MIRYVLQAALAQRHLQENRLRRAGFDLVGDGISLVAGDTFAQWDIFVIEPGSPRNLVRLHGNHDVNEFISKRCTSITSASASAR